MVISLLTASLTGLSSARLRPIPMGIIVTAISLIAVAKHLHPKSTFSFVGEFVMLQTVGEISYLFGLLFIA